MIGCGPVINAEESPDVQGQVVKITESLEDSYFGDGVTVRYLAPGDVEGHSHVVIDFGEGLAVPDTKASIADLTSAALGIAEYRSPATQGEISALLGRTRAATQQPIPGQLS